MFNFAKNVDLILFVKFLIIVKLNASLIWLIQWFSDSTRSDTLWKKMGWLCSNHNIELYEIRHAYSVLSISPIGFCIFPSIHVLHDLCSYVCMLGFFVLGVFLQFMLVFVLLTTILHYSLRL